MYVVEYAGVSAGEVYVDIYMYVWICLGMRVSLEERFGRHAVLCRTRGSMIGVTCWEVGWMYAGEICWEGCKLGGYVEGGMRLRGMLGVSLGRSAGVGMGLRIICWGRSVWGWFW